MADLVRARIPAGHHVTVPRAVADAEGWPVIHDPHPSDTPLDRNGRPRGPKFNTSPQRASYQQPAPAPEPEHTDPTPED